jgi:hypothetical protein
MALATYTDLKTSIASWLHRSDLTNQLDDFIALGEEMIWHDLRVKEMEADSTVTTSSRTISLPTSPLEIRRIYLDANPIQELKPMSSAQIVESYDATNGKPKFYAVIGSTIQFERTPDSSYTLYVNYYKKLTGLSGSNTTSDILTYYPSIYLWASCLAGAIWANDDASTTKFKALFDEAVAKANSQTKRGQYGAGMVVRAA